MDKEYTRLWHFARAMCPLEWTTWLGGPNLYDGGLFVNRTPEEHIYSRYLR